MIDYNKKGGLAQLVYQLPPFKHIKLIANRHRLPFLYTDSFSSFRAAFPEWCEEATTTNAAHPAKTAPPTEQLMGLR